MSIEPTENVGTRLMFENDRVRVWDLALAPGEWLERHIHREDFFFIVVAGGHMRMVDPDHPDAAPAFDFEDDRVVFIEANGGTVHQRLTNEGTKPYRNFVIELKSGKWQDGTQRKPEAEA